VRPWVITNEGDYWFTKKKDEDTVYVFVKEGRRWPYGQWKEIVLRSVAAAPETVVSVLGQSGKVLEYRPEVVPQATWKRQPDGLHIRAMRAQRLYNDRTWPNPVVLKVTHARAAFTPPRVATGNWRMEAGEAVLEGELLEMGKTAALEVAFEYRSIRGEDVNERTAAWNSTPAVRLNAPGRFSARVSGWRPGDVYEYRAVVRHPLLTLYGSQARAALR